MTSDENLFAYTISTVLNNVDKDYQHFIISELSKQTQQKILPGKAFSENLEKIKEILTNEKYFFERFNSLSIDAQQFYRSLYSIGRVGLPLKDQEKKDEYKIKKEVSECLDKLMVFAIPSRSNPDAFIIPVDYAMISSLQWPDNDNLLLVFPLRNYPISFLNIIAKYYGVKYGVNKNLVATEIYSNILKNLKETIRNINKKEREIIDYIMLSDGVTSFENLLNHFDMRKQSSYFYGLSFDSIFSPTSYYNGEPLISVMTKGLVYCAKGFYYNEIEYVYIPGEIASEIRNINRQEKKPSDTGKKQEPKILPSDMNNYGVDYASEMKKIFITLYYLESRAKRRSGEALKKFLSMPLADIEITLEHSKIERWITGKTSNLSITEEGLEFIEDRNFPSKLKQEIFDQHIFSGWKNGSDQGEEGNSMRKIFLEALYQLKSPARVVDIADEMKSDEKFFHLRRKLRVSMIESGGLGSYLSSPEKLNEAMESQMFEIILKAVYYLKIYGLIKLSSQDITPETYIFPEQEYIDILNMGGGVEYKNVEKNTTKPLKVLPNNEILITIDADFVDFKTLSGFSELISADILCTFRITKSSLSVYLNKSGKLEDIISFLEKKSSVPIPDTVRHLINDMEKKENEISIMKCQAVLQVSDRTVIDGIMKIRGISDMVETRISPEILVIKEGVSLYKFVTEIRKKGYIIPISIEKEKNRTRSTWSRY